MTNPRPGDFGLTNITGILGLFVTVGQMMLGDSSRYSHAFVLVSETTAVEARPFGAKMVNLCDYQDRNRNTAYSNYPLTDRQRHEIVMAAIALIGTPYSYLDYLALALERIGITPKRIRARVAGKGHMICSQLVDEAYRRGGVHLFKDGRHPGSVTPGDLTYSNYVVFPEDR